MSARQRVAVVTGGGGGIGAAIAEELGRNGWFVVTVDPLVTLDGTEQLPEPEETTASRIVAAGGSAQRVLGFGHGRRGARAGCSRTGRGRGGLDAVVNVAGITRQSCFAQGTEEDWLALLSVHLGGYLNVLGAALPLMAAAGHGRILGVTSGSGWRAADAGGYSCAKRAVASLTWQLGGQAPPGRDGECHVAHRQHTRMVAAALERARQEPAGQGGGGGFTLDAMPGPEDLGPLGAHLVGDGFGWCTGQVLFAGGPEVAVVDEPRLLEVVRSDRAASLEPCSRPSCRGRSNGRGQQVTQGGTNPRFGSIFDSRARRQSAAGRGAILRRRRRPPAARRVARRRARGPVDRLSPRRSRAAGSTRPPPRCAPSARRPARSMPSCVALAGQQYAVPSTGRVGAESWPTTRDHGPTAHRRRLGPRGVRLRRQAGRPVRLVTLTDATSPAGRSRAQASAQLARVRRAAQEDGSPPSPRASRRPTTRRASRPASSSRTCSANPNRQPWPEPSWWWARVDRACAAIHVRSGPSSTEDRGSPLVRRRPRENRRSGHPWRPDWSDDRPGPPGSSTRTCISGIPPVPTGIPTLGRVLNTAPAMRRG